MHDVIASGHCEKNALKTLAGMAGILMQVSIDIILITLPFLCTGSWRLAFASGSSISDSVRTKLVHVQGEIQPMIRFVIHVVRTFAATRRSDHCVQCTVMQIKKSLR
jgi:hypothetical protein